MQRGRRCHAEGAQAAPRLTLLWTSRALEDVAAGLAEVAAEDPGAAGRFNDRLLELVETTLASQPRMGRPGRISGTRELIVHPRYILAYRVRGEVIELLAFRLRRLRRQGDRPLGEGGRGLIGMDKRTLPEREICASFITPALRNPGGDEMLQIREAVSFTKGRIILRGKLVTRGHRRDSFLRSTGRRDAEGWPRHQVTGRSAVPAGERTPENGRSRRKAWVCGGSGSMPIAASAAPASGRPVSRASIRATGLAVPRRTPVTASRAAARVASSAGIA